jgi:hypothetical protein
MVAWRADTLSDDVAALVATITGNVGGEAADAETG